MAKPGVMGMVYLFFRHKALVVGVAFCMLTLGVNAQRTGMPRQLNHEISGLVTDSAGNPLADAVILLKSTADSVSQRSDQEGIFVFDNINRSEFTLTVSLFGRRTIVKRFLFNESQSKIILDPIVLTFHENRLSEVKVNGKPSIVYKTDTVEYKASDYQTRPYARVEELLKKMEGMEVAPDGTLTYQGQNVKKAKLNGKDFLGGNVAQTIKNLPAEIIEKLQVIDDYGDQAARTGVKEGTPGKSLNLVTKADRSIGNMNTSSFSYGSNNRYLAGTFGLRINGNKQTSVIGSVSNTINGVASANPGESNDEGVKAVSNSSSASGSGGVTRAAAVVVGHRDQWGDKVQFNSSYTLAYRDIGLEKSSVSQLFSAPGLSTVNETSTSRSYNYRHNASFELEYTPDRYNFLKLSPVLSLDDNVTSSQVQREQAGLINQSLQNYDTTRHFQPNFGTTLLYVHNFNNPKRSLSLQAYVNTGNLKDRSYLNDRILYRDDNQNPRKDSIINRAITKRSAYQNYKATSTYSEPVSRQAQLDLSVQFAEDRFQNIVNTENRPGSPARGQIDSLSNTFDYAFSQWFGSVSLHFTGRKSDVTLGLKILGTRIMLPTPVDSQTGNTAQLYFLPVARWQQNISQTQQLSVIYTADAEAPAAYQLNPVADYSNSTNPVYGNPCLKPALAHRLTIRYNNYLPNKRVNISNTLNTSYLQNQVTSNLNTVYQPQTGNLLYTTTFENRTGSYTLSDNYGLSKQLGVNQVKLELLGNLTFRNLKSFSNGIPSDTRIWRFNERFGPRITLAERFEINPFVSSNIYRSLNTVSGNLTQTVYTTSLNLDGRCSLKDDWTVSYNASKNFVDGIAANINRNPFIVNAAVEKRLFKQRSGVLKIEVFDLLRQNNFVNRIVNENSVTDTRTNALSRYIMLSFSVNLQKWAGTPQGKGTQLKRRNDGSFIYR